MRVKTTDTVIGRGKTHPGNMLKKVQDLKDYQEAHQNGTEVINGLSLLMNVWLHIYERIRKKILLIILKLPSPPSFFLFLFLFCLLFSVSLYEELLAVNIAILSHLKQGCQTQPNICTLPVAHLLIWLYVVYHLNRQYMAFNSFQEFH